MRIKMSKNLDSFYHAELEKLKILGQQFSQKHPQTAKHLGLDNTTNNDPLVDRLIESTAFLTASIQQNISTYDQRLYQRILSSLFPAFLITIPAITYIKIQSKEGNNKPLTIPKETLINYHLNDQKSQFSLCHNIKVFPIEISSINYSAYNDPDNKALTPFKSNNSLLSILFKPLSTNLTITEHTAITFVINPQFSYAYLLFEMIINKLSYITLRHNNKTLNVSSSQLKPTYINNGNFFLPSCDQTCDSYQILMDFSAFPEKFLSLSLTFPETIYLDASSTELEINFIFNEILPELVSSINDNSILINTYPVINVFEGLAEPIRVDNTSLEYPVILDHHIALEHQEIIKIHSADLINQQGETLSISHFNKPNLHNKNADYFWESYIKDLPNLIPTLDGTQKHSIKIGSYQKKTLDHRHKILQCHVYASNGYLPYEINQSTSKTAPCFTLSNNDISLDITQITPFSKRYTIMSNHSHQGLLLALLLSRDLFYTLHDNITDEIISLLLIFIPKHHYFYNAIIEGITSVTKKNHQILSPQSPQLGFISGYTITLSIDEKHFTHRSYFMLAMILDSFFSKQKPINSFTQLTIICQPSGTKTHWDFRL